MRAALFYSALVFGVGFVLGPVRILWAVPRFGTRMAELTEAPIMLAAIIVAAKWVVRRLAVPFRPGSRFGMGFIAVGFLLLAESTLVLGLQGLSIREYLASRDPVSGTVYYLSLTVFAIMPFFINRS